MLLEGFFQRWSEALQWVRPVAGPIAFPRLKLPMDADTFVRRLLEEQSTLMVPGTVYDFPGHLRLGFGRKNMPEALERLLSRLGPPR